MTRLLEGMRALVTGGSRGIGAAIALAYAEAGASVAICHRQNPERAAGVVEAMRRHGVEAFAVVADVSDEGDAVAFVAESVSRLGGLDVAVNNAGILLERRLVDTTAGEFDRVVAVNLRGTFLVGREAVQALLRRPDGDPPGRLINIGSDLAVVGREGMSAYCATKGAIAAMTRAWARELAPRVLVNAIEPGPIDTDMTAAESMSAEALEKDLATPLRRIGRPEEVAALAVFLAGPRAGFITGQCLGVNGGSAMR